jgi:hypothetical protein
MTGVNAPLASSRSGPAMADEVDPVVSFADFLPRVGVDDLVGEHSQPFGDCLRRILGVELYAALTLADLQSLAGQLTGAIAVELVYARNCADRPAMPATARQSFYDDLLDRVDYAELAAMFEGEIFHFIACRFISVEWWGQLRDPMPRPPDDFFVGVEPLEHRRR